MRSDNRTSSASRCRPRHLGAAQRLRALPSLAAMALLAALGGCDFPADPDGTLDHVKGHELIAGASAVNSADKAILTRLAERLDADLVIRDGALHDLVDDLEAGRLHVVFGDIPKDTPFAREVALSSAVGEKSRNGETTETVLMLKQGENAFLSQVNKAIHDE